MAFSPQTVRSPGFKPVKKGYDQAEVDDFKEKVAAAIETAQNQATAMEARARAPVAKLQEVSQQVSSGSPTGRRPSGRARDSQAHNRPDRLRRPNTHDAAAPPTSDAHSV